tara:strand:+ start:1302 stop:2417 length:1116 start_codon:yes stop_codon:yes gene_type:complete
MKKLIFRKFAKDTSIFFLIMCLTIGLIVWTLQAVNYFDFVTQDGHGLKTYFSYILLNFPKIIHRIIPFIFFISLFYIITDYEVRNELLIFWTSGISKITFANKIILLSVFLALIQILIGSFFSPLSQYKAREFLKNSNIDFFTSLIKEGKFINAVDGLTIFIDEKEVDGTYSNIFLDDSSKANSRMIYANNGILLDSNNKKIFRLFDGKILNFEKSKINVFEFDRIDFNLAEYSTNTILMPKIQEIPSNDLFRCIVRLKKNEVIPENRQFSCKQSIVNEITQELFKRFYKPLYIPIVAILCCFLIITSKNNINYEKNRKIVFLVTFFILILSEASLRYSTSSNSATLLYLAIPWVSFIIIYILLNLRLKNV